MNRNAEKSISGLKGRKRFDVTRGRHSRFQILRPKVPRRVRAALSLAHFARGSLGCVSTDVPERMFLLR
jgi:hypothetical protein